MISHAEALRKVRGLLKLAQSSNPNEAALAASRAQEIMDRHGIEAKALALETHEAAEPIRDFGEVPEGKLDEQPVGERWRGQLALVLCELNGCGCYLGHRGRRSGTSLELYGRPSSVETVRYLYGWIGAEVQRLAELHGAGLGAVWRRNFSTGCVETVSRRLRLEHEATIRAMREEAHQEDATRPDMSGEHRAFPPINPFALQRIESALVAIREGPRRGQGVWQEGAASPERPRFGHALRWDGARRWARGRAGNRAGRECWRAERAPWPDRRWIGDRRNRRPLRPVRCGWCRAADDASQH